MSDFKVTIERLIIEEHNNADALELAVIGGYNAVVPKNTFKTGELVAYIPEQAIVPEWLIAKMGLENKLAGRNKNRVKAVRLRGALSQGLVYKLSNQHEIQYMDINQPTESMSKLVEEGDDVADLLGIVKWEPEIPIGMNGEVYQAYGKTVKYDIENWKNHPAILQEGEDVVFTEKIHGTFCAFGKVGDQYIVHSKGQGRSGLAFTLGEANLNNLYVRQFNKDNGKLILDLISNFLNVLDVHGYEDNIFVLGEIFGRGIQDLTYDQDTPVFRIFDVKNQGEFINHDALVTMIAAINHSQSDVVIEMVPLLYTGPFSVEKMQEYTNGKETFTGTECNVREGIVMKVAFERKDNTIGRVILKSVSEGYLLRKGDVTEYN